MAYTYVMADLHGRADLFIKANKIIRDHNKGDFKVIVLGDFVDRGPNSSFIVEQLRTSSYIALQGNHEDIMLQALANPQKMRWWLGNGGGRTLLSYGHADGGPITPSVVPKDHIDWLMKLPLFYEDKYRIYVHGGVDHDTPMDQQSKYRMQWGLYTDEYAGSTQLADLDHCSGKHVVHGHHQSETHPLLRRNRTNLDSFAWYSGRLAIGVFDDDVPGGPVEILWSEA